MRVTKKNSKRRKPARSKQRDYVAEYKQRIARHKGLSRAIARGHPPKGVIGISLAAKLKVPPGTKIEDISVKTVDHPGASKKEIAASLKERGFTPTELRGIEFTDQETFVKQMLGYGFTFREAFDLYFGY